MSYVNDHYAASHTNTNACVVDTLSTKLPVDLFSFLSLISIKEHELEGYHVSKDKNNRVSRGTKGCSTWLSITKKFAVLPILGFSC